MRYFVAPILILVFVAAVGYFFLVPAFAGKLAVPSQVGIDGYGLRFYSLAILSGILAAFFVAKKFSAGFSLSQSNLEDLILLGVLGGLAGARLHHVLSEWAFYANRPELVPRFWLGGLGFFGAIIGALAAVGLYGRIKKLDLWKIFDLLAIVAPLGQAIGRWGNFFNQEAYGLPTALPWKMYVRPEHRLLEYLDASFFHPVFLYESFLDLMIFAFMLYLFRRRLPKGALFASYIIFYSMLRFFLEPLRADANLFSGFYSNQLLALVFMGLAAGVLFFAYKRRQKRA